MEVLIAVCLHRRPTTTTVTAATIAVMVIITRAMVEHPAAIITIRREEFTAVFTRRVASSVPLIPSLELKA